MPDETLRDSPAEAGGTDAHAPRAEVPMKKTRASRADTAVKLFVLDTNVLMHDPTSLFRFEEHDVYLPMVTLEELDDNKKGMSEVARNARQASRFLDEIVSRGEGDIESGYALKGKGQGGALGRLYLQTHSVSVDIPDSVASQKADNVILGGAVRLFPGRDAALRWLTEA